LVRHTYKFKFTAMKKSMTTFFIVCLAAILISEAQDTVRVKVLGKNMVTVIGDGARTDVKIGDNAININNGHGDTVKVRVGRKAVVIADGKHGSDIRFDRLDDKEFETWTGHPARFKGHWAAVEMGVNSFANVNYSGFAANFMDLNQNKSYETSINFLRYSIGLQNDKRNIGLVTGLGLTLNDYRFSNPYTLENNGGEVVPVLLDKNGLSKSKLSTSFLSVPLILEFQVPVKGHDKRFYFSGGLIGGLKVGSHTKVKQNGDKSKSRDDFNINPFRYGATARFGYKGINVFGTCYFSTFYKKGRGPEMFPFTIGIGLMNW
jgi:hypothetical protein